MANYTLEKILIIQTAFLGDVILATSLIEKIHYHYPETRIDFLLRKGNESILEHHPIINEVLIFNKKEHKYSNLLSTIKAVRQKKYDMVINLQRFASTGLITLFSRAAITVGFNKNPLSVFFGKTARHQFNGMHEIERNQLLINWFTDEFPSKPKLYPTVEEFDLVKEYKKDPYLCMAPASVWFTKQYPEEKWIDLVARVQPGVKIYLLGGPDDNDLSERIRNKAENMNVVNLCGKLGICATAALMKDAVLNIVNDSAPMHIASAINAPVCAIYCSTVPSFGFGPLSDLSHIIEIEEKISCRPCGIHGRNVCPLGHFDCAHKINNEKIIELIYQLLPSK